LRKYPFTGVGCSLIEEPKNRTEAWQNRVFGEQKPLNRSLQNFAHRVYKIFDLMNIRAVLGEYILQTHNTHFFEDSMGL